MLLFGITVNQGFCGSGKNIYQWVIDSMMKPKPTVYIIYIIHICIISIYIYIISSINNTGYMACHVEKWWLIGRYCFHRHVQWRNVGLPDIKLKLVGGWATPLKNMSSSVGTMKFPIWWESHKIPWFQTTNRLRVYCRNSFQLWDWLIFRRTTPPLMGNSWGPGTGIPKPMTSQQENIRNNPKKR